MPWDSVDCLDASGNEITPTAALTAELSALALEIEWFKKSKKGTEGYAYAAVQTGSDKVVPYLMLVADAACDGPDMADEPYITYKVIPHDDEMHPVSFPPSVHRLITHWQ